MSGLSRSANCAFHSQIHGNICMRAIVVTPSLDWRLHGFDLLSEHQPTTGFEWPLMAATWMVGAQYKPAEVCWLAALFCRLGKTGNCTPVVGDRCPCLLASHDSCIADCSPA